MECKPITNGNVILVEPNCVNINNDVINGIPQYQDMYVFAELTARSRGRTVIINGNATSEKSKKINLMGNDQNNENDNPNYLNFTTNYYDGSTGNQTHYEGFGINNIKIVVNSSFIPQVNIQFIDIRGLAFFNQTDSPYRILFDFPPPIFTLIVKGYYGKAITYELHLVKYTSEFSAANGNFIIDAQFVATTFAPLTDILFRYVVNFPLINNTESLKPATGIRPKNTYELIMKLKNLYAAISDKLDTDTDNKRYNSILREIEGIDTIFDMLKAVITNENEVLSTPSVRPYLLASLPNEDYKMVTLNAGEQYHFQILRDLSEFDEIIKNEKTTGIKRTSRNRLYIAYVAGSNLPQTDVEYNPLQNEPNYIPPVIDPFAYSTKNYRGFKTALDAFSQSLAANNLPSFNIRTGDIGKPVPITNGWDAQTSSARKTEYYGIDITDYYYKLYEKNLELIEDRNNLSGILAEKINNMVSQNLGMTPSIYNVFEVILNDVDDFFFKLRTVSELAEHAHNIPEAKAIIANNNIDSPTSEANVPDHVYSFPLIINEANVYGGVKRERIAPIELSKQVSFPELELVTDFMDTFALQRSTASLYNARGNQNDDGTFKWIPISPLDSVLGGTSPESPYLNVNDNVRAEITRILMKRFYMLTQGSIFKTFYSKASTKRDAYVSLYAESEAINIITTLISERNADNIEQMANKYKNDIQAFYDFIETIPDTYDNGDGTSTNNLYNFPINDPKYFPITPSNPFEGRVYVDKKNDEFVGVNWYTSDVVINDTTNNENSERPVDNFNKNAKTNWFKPDNAEYFFYEFTRENVIYLRDINENDISSITVINGLPMFTRYLTNNGDGFIKSKSSYQINGVDVPNEYFPGTLGSLEGRAIEGQKIAYEQGNQSFNKINIRDKRALKYGNDILNIWSQQLTNNSVVDVITGDTQNLSTVIILSNFGTTASPFNVYSNSLNSLIFDTPAAVEVPAFYAPYLGALLTAIDDDWVDDILTFFTGTTGNNGMGTNFPNKGFYIFADLHDVENHLSKKDKEMFKQAYRDYVNNQHQTIVNGIVSVCNYVRDNSGNGKMFLSQNVGYGYSLNPQYSDLKNAVGRGNYYFIIQSLMEKKTLVNFSQITFEMSDTYNVGYVPISVLNDDTEIANVNEKYFQKFFNRLASEIHLKKTKLKDEEDAIKKTKGDIDIINQLYYSFKNVNDKWLAGSLNDSNYYPFNKPNGRLIDSFAFVDRAMNPIGDTIINAEILTQMFDDPNISLFSVLTQLLSLNGFEFFPLQNFMRFSGDDSWMESFKIHTGGVYNDISTAFVCMYIGGTSSYPSVSGNGFENDGIIDISKPGVTDYFTSKPKESQGTVNDSQEDNNTDFPWREVRAFRVRFGEQNQSMFTDIKIDSKEYPETNESIQILSRLAGDNNPDAPVPKGQNLYNLYENRSYKATVTGFGNAMIQPTQYFQLENIPLFNGAYIILSVEHNITANKMTTSFSGTKLLKYPVPRVLNPMAFTNYNPNQSAGDVVVSAANVSQREETHYDAMYDNTPNSLKIG